MIIIRSTEHRERLLLSWTLRSFLFLFSFVVPCVRCSELITHQDTLERVISAKGSS